MIETNFKHTEIGLIPHDWEVFSVGNDCYIKARIGWQGLTTAEYLDHGEYGLITSTDIVDGKINWNTCWFVSEDRYRQDAKIQVRGNDVLISKDGTIGKVGIVKELPYPATLNSGVFVIRTNNSQQSQKGLSLAFISPFFADFIKRLTAGSTIVHLYQKDIVNYQYPLPPTVTEQERIVDALSSIDTLIGALNEQIEKKRHIKQGTMQQLITGKKRLAGFSGEWKNVKLGDLLAYEQPTRYLVQSTEYTELGIPVLTAGKTFILGYTIEDSGIFNKLPVIIFDDFVVESKYVTFPFKVKSSAMKMLSLRDATNNLRFIYEKMQCIDFPIADHKRHWISEYSQIEITIPDPAEQSAIAAVLSGMDTEIAALEQKRDKYIAIKSGMMQDLLTGKIRLV